MDIKHIAVAFVDAINSRDTEALAQLMEKTCGLDIQHIAKDLDFKISIERIVVDGDTVLMIGTAHGTCNAIPTIWKAEIQVGKIVDWTSYSSSQLTCLN
jgi:hypothetical protein